MQVTLSLEGMAHLEGDSIKKLIIDVTDESTIQAGDTINP